MTTKHSASLTASDESAQRLTIDPPAEVTASASSRQIAGMVLPWRTPGRTSRGKVRVDSADAIKLPKDLSRVKLLHGHRHEGGKAVGHLIEATPLDEGLHMRFQLGTGDPATAALTAAAENIDDGLSVELTDVKIAGSGRLTASRLDAVALVAVPAFDDARVAEVTASACTCNHGDDQDDDQDDEDGEDEQTPPAEDDADDDQTPDDETDEEDTMPKNKSQRRLSTVNASAPNSIGPKGGTTAAPALTASTVAEVLSAARRGDQLDDTLSAALEDITHTDMLDSEQPSWLGEIWDGRSYERSVTDLVTPKTLTAFRMTGFRVTDKPGVDWWDGDKEDIPSFPMAVEPVEFKAKKIAGGNDIAREWVDFGWTEMIAAYWRGMADSYAMLTDGYIAKQIADAAASIGSAKDVLRAAVRGATHIANSTNAPASYVLLNPSDAESILDITAQNEPAYLDAFGPLAAPGSWRTSPLVDEGKVIVGQKSAIEYYELAGSPLRVNAVDIARGGYDYAMFGYCAAFLRDERGLVSVDIDGGSSGGGDD